MSVSVKKYSDKQVADIIICEGLGYAVQHYLGADSIKNRELAAAWGRAKEALSEIEAILGNKLDEV